MDTSCTYTDPKDICKTHSANSHYRFTNWDWIIINRKSGRIWHKSERSNNHCDHRLDKGIEEDWTKRGVCELASEVENKF